MIYTIGHTESYREYLRDSTNPHIKLGRRGHDDPDNPNYEGGSAWETEDEALAACPEGFDVFGLNARWRVDTAPSGHGWDNLLVDSEFFELRGTTAQEEVKP